MNSINFSIEEWNGKEKEKEIGYLKKKKIDDWQIVLNI